MAWHNAFRQPSTYPNKTAKIPCFPRRIRQFGWLTVLGITQGMAPVLLSESGQAAEHIVIHYGSFNGAIALDDLEASLGASQTTQERSFRVPIPPEVSARLQKLLTHPLPFLPPEQIENLFTAPLGKALLGAVAEVVLVDELPEQGLMDLRAALVGAAASGDGVTGLNVLRHFPGDLHWDARRTIALLQRQKTLNQQTGNFLALLDHALEQQLDTPVQQGYGRGLAQPWEKEDLRLRGPWAYRQAELKLWDEQRDRPFLAQLYLPDMETTAAVRPGKELGEAIAVPSAIAPTRLEPISLVVMSHGLAANRHSRSFLAEHLASHGIAVAMVQHSGSDSEQFQGLLDGKVKNAASVQSFLDRPQDISFLLDELEHLIHAPVGKRGDVGLDDDRWMLAQYPLQFERVAVFGHSFGAYTALALAGAEINFAQLHQDCEPEAMLLDWSLVLQCQALQLESKPLPVLKDDRVVALMLADPMSRSIFGPKELRKVSLPVVWTGGQRDRFTPFSLSQLPSFHWLGSKEKYLAVAEATSHIYLQPQNPYQSDGVAQVSLNERVTSQPQAIQDYTNALGLAFTRTYLHREGRYQAYFAAPYGQRLSQSPYHLRLWSPSAATAQQSLSQLISP